MSLSLEVVNYIFQAFPNASIALEEIVSKYARELTTTFAFGLVALWEFIYDRLAERDPERIYMTAASEKIEEASISCPPGSPPNGYSIADKNVLEKILKNTNKEVQKNQLHQYRKNGTLEDAREDFKKFSGDMEDKGSNVWIKTLPHGKIMTVREKSTYPANATLEIQTERVQTIK
jgi:hypothetical protein